MLHFDSDYMEGAHPMVMQRLVETNLEQTVGYGEDGYTTHAANLIREAFGCPDALVRFRQKRDGSAYLFVLLVFFLSGDLLVEEGTKTFLVCG